MRRSCASQKWPYLAIQGASCSDKPSGPCLLSWQSVKRHALGEVLNSPPWEHGACIKGTLCKIAHSDASGGRLHTVMAELWRPGSDAHP